MQSDLKCNKQCLKAVSMANKVLGMIKRSFSIRDKEIILQLYKSLVRSQLEYSIQVWRPHYQKDTDLMEMVQRRAKKLISGLMGYTYEDRLNILKLTTLETRRLRVDLIEVLKMFTGFDMLDPLMFFLIKHCTY